MRHPLLANRRLLLALVALAAGGVSWALRPTAPESPRAARPGAPATLAETGLYADPVARTLAPGVTPYSPQYPLWSDGAAKSRWVRLPPGTSIDASEADAWTFPVGTRFWKEFRFGRRVETRYLERATEREWLFATYVWSEDGTRADLVPESGLPGAAEIRPGVRHDVPSRADCAACHEGRRVPVLGFSALQLSPDRDPLAPHAEVPEPGSVDLAGLMARRLLSPVDPALSGAPPRVPARSPRERAVLGWLHANCGSCHTAGGDLRDLGMDLEQRLREPGAALASVVGVASRFRLPGTSESARLLPGEPEASVLVHRAASRDPSVQMPPLGTRLVDEEALRLLKAWVRDDLAAPASTPVLSQESTR